MANERSIYHNILLTAFRGTSAELLIKNAKNCKTLLLPNDKIRDSDKLIKTISNGTIDYVISFGQRPNIRDKVCIETRAIGGDFSINTNFDVQMLKCFFEQKGIISKLSYNPGTSFCNQLYLNGLKYLVQNDIDTKMVFVHIPFVKNICDFDGFRAKILDTITDVQNHY